MTAVTRPSSTRASAIFSLVASAWKSTRITGVVRRASATSSSTTTNGWSATSRKSWPCRFSTATGVPSRGGHDGQALARRVRPPRFAGRTIRSELVEERDEVALAPDVVAERDRVGARGEELLGELRGQADAVRGVLAVHDADVDLELLAQVAQAGLDGPAAGSAEDVAQEEDAHVEL